MSIQMEDGAFPAPDGTPYTFDTGQIMRGLCAAIDDVEGARESLVRASDWVLTQIEPKPPAVQGIKNKNYLQTAVQVQCLNEVDHHQFWRRVQIAPIRFSNWNQIHLINCNNRCLI